MKSSLVMSSDTTFEDAVQALDSNGNGFLAVVDNHSKLIGILTDGDIRRAILNKRRDINEIINHNPVTMSHNIPERQALAFLKSIHRRHLPIVDKDNRLVDVIFLDDLEFKAKCNRVMIMAGGYGTRLGDLTKDTPKPMLTVGNKPILEYILNHCYEHGYTNIYISVNEKSEKIRSYFKDGSQLGLSITYVEEKEKLGTAGALTLIKEELVDPLMVINGDILTTLNLDEFLEFHVNNNSEATMCTREVEHQVAYGVVKLDGTRITSLEEKPKQKYFINGGIYILNPDVLKYIPKNQYFDMTSLFQVLISNGKNVNAHSVDEYWIDIGQIKDYESAKNDFRFDL